MRSINYLKKMMQRHGLSLTLNADGSTLDGAQFKAFIHPLRYKNKMYLDGTYSRVGYVDQAYYLYIGPADIDICSLPDDASVEFRGKNYNFTRREQVAIGDDTVYYWSVLRREIAEPQEVTA